MSIARPLVPSPRLAALALRLPLLLPLLLPPLLVPPLLAASAPARADCLDGRPRNSGHRGTGTSNANNPYPENTIPSLLQAAAEGATRVEFDVRISSDGVPVLMHDASVDETTDGEGCVSSFTVAELQALDAGAGTPMAGQGITIPTLAEVVDQVALDLNVELKFDGGGPCPELSREEFAATVLAALDGDPHDRAVALSSFDFMLLQAARAQDPEIYLGHLALTADLLQLAVDAELQAVNLGKDAINAAIVADIHAAGLEVNTWTVDDPGEIAAMFDADVDEIITNEPPRVEAERALRCPDEPETTGEPQTTGEPETTEGPATGDDTASTGAGETLTTTDDGSGDTTGAGTDSGTMEEGEGCGCRARGHEGAGAGAGALAWLLLLARRRRRPA
ncbi:MAG: hypothetical protein H6713_15320 [Myxococcales bacterium]|nr:hypothetical protein [Myxococcales bacterium]